MKVQADLKARGSCFFEQRTNTVSDICVIANAFLKEIQPDFSWFFPILFF